MTGPRGNDKGDTKLGDLSIIANDSRYRGPVKASDIIGVADLRYWPLTRFAALR